MKKIRAWLSATLVLCLMMSLATTAFAADAESDFADKVAALGEKYGVAITVESKQRTSVVSAEDEEAELAALEERLIAGQAALAENNRLAEESYAAIVASERYDEDTSGSVSAISPRATHTVFRYQTIGYYYPNATTIRCYITGNVSYSEFHKRDLWGGVVSNGSSLYSGMGDSWDETDCEIQRIDGGRTYYVQVWGDLEETYTSWFNEYTVTSEGWRIWYEAYCPA